MQASWVIDTSHLVSGGGVRENCFTTPAVREEMKTFPNVEFPDIIIKPPNYYSESVPAYLFNKYILKVEEKIAKGLKVAEKRIEDTRALRKEYRDSVRCGLLDSAVDFGVIVLALNLKAGILCRDEGLKEFAEELGIIVN